MRLHVLIFCLSPDFFFFQSEEKKKKRSGSVTCIFEQESRHVMLSESLALLVLAEIDNSSNKPSPECSPFPFGRVDRR